MNRMERFRVKLARYCPPVLPVCLVYALISLGMLLYAKGNAPAADLLNHWYGGAVRIIMAYDLKTPLAVMSGYAEIFKKTSIRINASTTPTLYMRTRFTWTAS